MSATLKSSLFDEPDAAEASAPPKRFKFAATFVIDLVVSLAFVAVVLPCWATDFDRGLIMAPTFLLGVLILVDLRRQGAGRRPSRQAAAATRAPM